MGKIVIDELLKDCDTYIKLQKLDWVLYASDNETDGQEINVEVGETVETTIAESKKTKVGDYFVLLNIDKFKMSRVD